MTRTFQTVAAVLVAAAALVTPLRAHADDSLAAARELYAGAAYEDALAILSRLRPADTSDERSIAQYRAFCLLALGRAAEADQAIEWLVTVEPSYHPPETEASPRLRAAFGDVRRRMLPAIIQARYGSAKTAFDRKDLPAARDGFLQVIALLSDPDLGAAAGQPPLVDLRTLAAGFSELSATIPSAPLALPSPVAAAAAAAEPPPPAPAAARVYTADDANVVPPAIVRQTVPPPAFKPLADTRAAIAVIVDESGGIESARMLEPFRTPYDGTLLEAASRWRYRPALLDGVPVKFRKIIVVNVTAAK